MNETPDDDSPVYALFRDGRAHLRAGRSGAAIEAFAAARDLQPAKSSIREMLALAYLRAGRLIDAEAELATAIELAPNEPYCYFLRGRAQEGLGFTAQARGSYKLAVWLDPSSTVYQAALAAIGEDR